MKRNILFSAPHNFLVKNKNKIVNFFYKEIWNSNDLISTVKIHGWIVNPGQKFVINEKILSKLPNLEIIVTPSTGTNHIDKNICKKKKIKVLSLLDDRNKLDKIRASSEFSFLLILNSLRNLQKTSSEILSKRWREKEDIMRGQELFGKKVGIIGLGRIGKNVAKWSQNFGAKVLYCDPNVNTKHYTRTTLNNIFKSNDIVLLSCALNEDTYQMINIKHLRMMKKGSHFINTSRGEVINQNDLIKFLKKNKEINFSCDVLQNEVNGRPLTKDLIQLYKEKKIFITPHIAGATIDSQIKAAEISMSLIKKFYEKN